MLLMLSWLRKWVFGMYDLVELITNLSSKVSNQITNFQILFLQLYF